MNTIPLIFNERQIERTVLGGENTDTESYSLDAKIPCSVVLLNRGSSHYRQQNIDNLQKVGFLEIVSVESSSLSYNLEDFALRHPLVKFIIPQEKLSVGDMINIGIAECKYSHVLVLWNDIFLTPNLISSAVFDKIFDDETLCVCPLLHSSSMQILPTEMIPSIEKTRFTVTPAAPRTDKAPTVYPFDFIGLYNRQRFMQLGGFDYTITNPYWQNMDFSLRAWLWGEKIHVATSFKLKYEDESPLENITADITQLRFYLKNCSSVYRFDYSYIPKSRFFSFWRIFPGTPFEALKVFIDARKWVHTNRYRFKTDIGTLIETWNRQSSNTQPVGAQ